jgi:methyl-accepting chemotaxis protein
MRPWHPPGHRTLEVIMNIKSRIWSLPVISVVIFGIGIAVSSYFANTAQGTIERTGKVDYAMLAQSQILRTDVQLLADDLKNAVMEGDKKRLDSVDDNVAKLNAKFALFSALPGHQDTGSRLTKEFNRYAVQGKRTARIMLEIETGDAAVEIAGMQKTFNTIAEDLDKTIVAGTQQFAAGISASAASVRMVQFVSIGAAIMVILSLVVVAHFVIRAIWQQLGGEPEYAAGIARAVAAGDLSMPIVFDQKQPDSLLAALSEMRLRLEGIVGDIQTSAEEIRHASAEIASGNADLSSRTESQAMNLGHAAHSMAEMTGAVQQNAESARHATDQANRACEVAVRGGAAVGQVVNTMDDISASAKKIVEIISVIDGIAFQTNILALNAAVEAARAGEQGRGFAVVASEVRNLAQRSASAAKEIKGLIVDSVNKVATGSALVQDAGKTMGEVVGAVQQVTTLIREISESSRHQSTGLETLNASVTEMDESTQRNAAMTEQAAAAAGSMQEQAIQLSEAVGVFILSAAASKARVVAEPVFAHIDHGNGGKAPLLLKARGK